jgi:ribonuclease HI
MSLVYVQIQKDWSKPSQKQLIYSTHDLDNLCMKRIMDYFYAVAKGRHVGVFSTWEQCNNSVIGFPGSAYKKFKSFAEAEAFTINASSSFQSETPQSALFSSQQDQQQPESRKRCSSPSPSSTSFAGLKKQRDDRVLQAKSLGPGYLSSSTRLLASDVNTSMRVSTMGLTLSTRDIRNPVPQSDKDSAQTKIIKMCKCNLPATKRKTNSLESANYGREYYTCASGFGKSSKSSDGCKFFEFVDGKGSKHLSTKDSEPSLGNVSNLDFVIYTDGACRGNTNVAVSDHPAGFGCVILSNCVGEDESAAAVVAELYGPVVLDSSSRFFMGSTVKSNNTAELTAIGEALLYVLHCENTPRMVAIRYDSEYAAKSVQGVFNGEKNVELIKSIRETLSKVKQRTQVCFSHVKGHSGHRWNDRADSLASMGAAGLQATCGRYTEELSSGTPSDQGNFVDLT